MTQDRKKLYEEYRKLGMTEAQIEEIKRFDDEMEEKDREYAEHTVPLAEYEKEVSSARRRRKDAE